MKKHILMSEEARESQIKLGLDKILSYVNKLASSFFKDIEITIEDSEFGDCEPIINCKQYGVSIMPVVRQRETIGSMIDCIAWQVGIETYTHATYWEPEVYDVSDVGEPLLLESGAAFMFIKTIFGRMVDFAADSLADQEMAEQYEAEQYEADEFI